MDTQEAEILRSKALNFDICDMLDYDPSLPPQNGHHYLYSVMSEAAKCPQIVVADLGVLKTKFKRKQTYFVLEDDPPSCDPDFKPTKEWQIDQVAEFSNLRQQIGRRRHLMQNVPLVPEDELNLPDSSDEKGWHKYCFGDETVPETLPSLSTLIALNQFTLNSILKYFISWLNKDKIKFNRGTTLWLYSVMSCLETPLTPEICASIRDVARKCVVHRSKLVDKNDELLTALNLLICLVSNYFRQLDLSD